MIFNAWMWSFAIVLSFSRTRDWNTLVDMSSDRLERVGGNDWRTVFPTIEVLVIIRDHTVQME